MVIREYPDCKNAVFIPLNECYFERANGSCTVESKNSYPGLASDISANAPALPVES